MQPGGDLLQAGIPLFLGPVVINRHHCPEPGANFATTLHSTWVRLIF